MEAKPEALVPFASPNDSCPFASPGSVAASPTAHTDEVARPWGRATGNLGASTSITHEFKMHSRVGEEDRARMKAKAKKEARRKVAGNVTGVITDNNSTGKNARSLSSGKKPTPKLSEYALKVQETKEKKIGTACTRNGGIERIFQTIPITVSHLTSCILQNKRSLGRRKLTGLRD